MENGRVANTPCDNTAPKVGRFGVQYRETAALLLFQRRFSRRSTLLLHPMSEEHNSTPLDAEKSPTPPPPSESVSDDPLTQVFDAIIMGTGIVECVVAG